MKTATQSRSDLEHVAQLIEKLPVAMMTTQEADGALSSRPMAVLEMDASGALWFFTDLRSAKIEQLGVANLGFIDPATHTYVSLSGRGEIDTDRRHIEALWTSSARQWFPDGPDSSMLALLKFSPDRADYWDADDGRMQREIGVIVASSPGASGIQGSYTHLSGALPATSADKPSGASA